MRVKVAQSVVYEVVEGQAVVLSLEGGQYFALNDSGTRIWQLIEELGDTDAILDQMESEFDADRVTLEGDLKRLLDGLAQRGLVDVST